LFQQFSNAKENVTAIGSIFNFMFQSPDKRPLLLPKYPVVLYNCPYYALLSLEAEEWYIQGRNKIWKNLLMKLHLQQGKANVDDALKVKNTVEYFMIIILSCCYFVHRKCVQN